MTPKQAVKEIAKLLPNEYIEAIIQCKHHTYTNKSVFEYEYQLYAGHTHAWIRSNESMQDAVNKATEIILNAQAKSQQESSQPEQSSVV